MWKFFLLKQSKDNRPPPASMSVCLVFSVPRVLCVAVPSSVSFASTPVRSNSVDRRPSSLSLQHTKRPHQKHHHLNNKCVPPPLLPASPPHPLPSPPPTNMEGLGSHAVMDSTQFKLTELLKEVHLHHSSHFSTILDNTVSAIKSCIDQIPLDFKVTADLAPKFVRDIGADKVDFIFKKPSLIEIGGSYSFQSLARPELNVDLIMRLPKGCFHEKDYLNYRYHAKRCLYLCLIKKYLEASPSIGKVEWSTFQNEARKPLLIVYPAAKVAEFPGVSVRIIPSAMSLFSSSKLNMKRNNIHNSNHGAALQATPKYNSSILEDMFLEDIEFVNKSFLGWKEIREALVLLKVWARQRSSVYVHDCLNGF
ncbi:hypothetical protein PIB30_019795 [Stylosanthes scabra]|uniref:Nrap protein domain-containing protein n=1 Tax=Stylosanthes scabra TaxID=79078 RepID=A0ABU6Z8N7_9FABA|nr:hypothetical protein [Stylosanthes scabra]